MPQDMQPKRRVTNIRPRGGDGPVYSPQRDLAYIYAPAMREAITALDEVNWSEPIRELVSKLGITEDDIGEAVRRLTEAHAHFVNDPEVQTPNDALNKTGWYDLPAACRYLIYGRLGEVMLGGFFVALRDTSRLADESAQSREIAEFIAAGREVMERSSGAAPRRPDESQLLTEVRKLEAQLRGVQLALVQAHKLCADHQAAVNRWRTHVTLAWRAANMGLRDSIRWLFMSPMERRQFMFDSSKAEELDSGPIIK